ncbi:DUF1365 domain-containing protein [Aliiroseovarius sp. S1339]|uniref:DUF1365 domain-containing protein n=1 Tax=Aliiroseovarius sp. S1339 TaxID=2936990 RepID=UPI0020BDA57B|nr:DUF1365 domain-containing protein [Aliiroseovarius sp. S1339]MCK8464659.1 DUF1365 domain-containing protein [Aliiroseovarius sp. S1339]
MVEHIQAHTLHARRGKLKNAFTYGVDYVLCDLSSETNPALLSRNRFNLWSLWDKHHGGPRGDGQGLDWFSDELEQRGLDTKDHDLTLLTQPSFLGFHFNPISFWIATKDGTPRAFIAEVNNTFGHRHCYFCAHEDFSPIEKRDAIIAEKMMHVSPFQKVEGQYRFNFGMTDDQFDIRILYENGDEGVLATLAGDRRPATNASLAWAALRRPFGALRVVFLIYWQALILYFKRAPFLRKPAPPEPLVSDSKTYQGTEQ